jgi:hypothetical protein
MAGLLAPKGDGVGEPVEITAIQKMLSATSGSLLTGLLGTSQSLRYVLVHVLC